MPYFYYLSVRFNIGVRPFYVGEKETNLLHLGAHPYPSSFLIITKAVSHLIHHKIALYVLIEFAYKRSDELKC
jgi:hypothetical protein